MSPLHQLLPLVPTSLRSSFHAILKHLASQSRSDLCHALIAFIRFGIKRHFDEDFLEFLFTAMVEVLEDPDADEE